MPHAFWHQWGDERTEQERLQAAALERIDNLERFGTADPSIWQEYIQAPIQDDVVPAVTDAFGNYVSNVTGRAQDTAEQIYSLPYVPEVVGGAVGGIEKVQENVFNPIVSRSLEPLPIKWEESPPDAPKGGEGAWWDSVVPDRLQQGRVVRDFDQYVTPEGGISPGGVLRQLGSISPATGGLQSAIEEKLPITPVRPDTLQQEKIMEEARERGMGTDVSATQQRHIREDLYKLPPYTRGIAEELPWFAIPTAGGATAAIKGLRTGQALATTGRLGAAAPAARVGLQAAEIGLKPIAYGERLLEKAVMTPLKVTGSVITGGMKPLSRARTNWIINKSIKEVNVDVANGQVESVDSALEALERMFSNRLGIDEKLFSIENGRIVRSEIPIPENVNLRYQEDNELNRLFGEPLSDTELAAKAERLGINLPEPPQPVQRFDTETGELLPEFAPSVPEEAIPPRDVFQRTTPTAEETIMGARPVARAVPETTQPTTGKQPEPWEQSKEQFRKPSGEDYRGETESYIRNRTNSNNPQELLAWYQQKYPELRGVTIGGLQATRESGPLVNEGVTRIIRDNGKFNPAETQIHLTQDADLVVARHEIEHLLDAIHGFADEGKQAFGRYGHEEFNASDYLHRSLVRDAVEEGLPVPESVLRDYPDLAARQTPTAAAVERPLTATETIMGGRQPYPTQRQAQPANFQATRAETAGGRAAMEVEQAAGTGAFNGKPLNDMQGVPREVSEIGGTGQVATEIKNLTPGAADYYVKLMFSLHDSTFALRVLQDNYFRSINPQASFRPGSHRDVVAGVLLSSGAPIRGMKMYENFIKTQIEKHLGNGVEQADIERYLQNKHWLSVDAGIRDLQEREGRDVIGRLEFPDIIDPATKEVTPSDGWRNWISDLESTKTPEQMQRIEAAAEAVRDVYSGMRKQLLEEGIIDQKLHDDMLNKYEWYNPIDYVEMEDINRVAQGPVSLTGRGIYKYSENPDVMGALPPMGEVLARRMIMHELRVHRNRVAKAFVRMGEESNIGLRDVTSEFTKPRKTTTDTLADGTKVIREEFNTDNDLYNQTLGTGYISFYEDGKRKIYGMLDERGNSTYVDKIWWDTLNGRAGLGVRGGMEVNSIFAMTNSFFKSTYTTFDPLFMLGNGLIDQFVVALKYRVMPYEVWIRLTRSAVRRMTGGEDRFRELMEMSGGYMGRIYNTNSNVDRIQREIAERGQLGATVVRPDSSARRIADSLTDGAKKYFPKPVKAVAAPFKAIPKVGEYVEQAPRLLVGQKVFKRLVGNKEWKRLMSLSREQWEIELTRNWKNTGKGLMDSPEARQAAINALESTVNFGRGGNLIRRANNYVMFLNAAFEGAKVPFRMLGVDLHPNIKLVENPVAGGRKFEWGNFREQVTQRRGQTGKYDAPLGSMGWEQFPDSIPLIGGKSGMIPMDSRAAAFLTVGTAVTSYAALHGINNMQNPQYWDVPAYIRYNSIIVMLPTEKDEDGNPIIDPNTNRPVPNYITIPHRTRELAIFFGGITYLMEGMYEDNPNDFKLFAKQMWGSASPVNDLPLPEVASITLEEMLGIDFFRGEPIVNPDYEHLEPTEQYGPHTSETARLITERIGDEDWLSDIFKSPQRLEHMYESATGGVGRRVEDMSDYIILLFQDMRTNEQRPMSVKAQEYRDMNRTARREFLSTLSESEYEEFDKEIRKPSLKSEDIFGQILQATGIEPRFAPDRAGGLRELSTIRTEGAVEGVSAEDSRRASSKLRQVKRDVLTTQQENDKNLGQWMQVGGMSGLSPEEWREERKSKWKVIEGAELLTKYTFPKAVQGKDPAIKQQWYDSIYNAAGTMPDIRSQGDLLVAGYYNITSPEDDPTRTWSDYFNDRDTYVTSIQERADAAGNPEIFEEFSRALTANLTDTETVYNTASKYLSNYWDIGSDINHILPNATATAPELAQLWESYLNADYGTQRTMRDRNRQLDTLVQRRSQIRKQVVMDDYQQNGYGYMDSLLAFWYGSFYQPITPQGKEIHSQMYGGAGSSRLPVTPQEQPLRLR